MKYTYTISDNFYITIYDENNVIVRENWGPWADINHATRAADGTCKRFEQESIYGKDTSENEITE